MYRAILAALRPAEDEAVKADVPRYKPGWTRSFQNYLHRLENEVVNARLRRERGAWV